MSPVSVPPLDERIYEVLSEFPREILGQRLFHSWELVDRYGRGWAIRLATELGVDAALATRPHRVSELLERSGFVPGFAPPLRGLLRQLAAMGLVEASGPEQDAGTAYRLAAPLPADQLLEVRAACLALDPANAPALDLLDLAGHAYREVARGAVKGHEALLGLGQTRLWLAYFSNDNPTYGLNNRLAAVAATRRLLPGPLRVLEVGGGGGSASEALLEALAARGRLADVVRYRFTEPSPFFRRGAERKLRARYPGLALEVGALDIDRPLGEQGEEPDSYDLVYGVNVLHVARDLPATLRELLAVLAPGGRLIAAEAMPPGPEQPLTTELVFLLLDSYSDVVLDPELRPTPGFLAAGQWRQLAIAAGFDSVEVVPDHLRLRPVYPRFSTGVVCARRPP